MIKSINISKLGLSLFIGIIACLLSSCDNEVDIQQAYPFTLETMPVQTKIVRGETAEIRCTLRREGRYDEARYTIRYFQPDGKGTLRMDDGTVFLPLSARPRGVPPLLYLRIVRSADHRHLRRGQFRAMRAAYVRLQQ